MIATKSVFTVSADYGPWLASHLPFTPGRTIGLIGGALTGKTTIAAQLALDAVRGGSQVLFAGMKRREEPRSTVAVEKVGLSRDEQHRLILVAPTNATWITDRVCGWRKSPHPYVVILDDLDCLPGDAVAGLAELGDVNNEDGAILVVTASPGGPLVDSLSDRIELERRANGTLMRLYVDDVHVAEQLFDSI